MASKFRSASMFVTFIRAENTKALINQMQLVACGMQGKTCLGKETACYRCGRIIYSTSMLWSSSTQNVTIPSCNRTHAAVFKEMAFAMTTSQNCPYFPAVRPFWSVLLSFCASCMSLLACAISFFCKWNDDGTSKFLFFQHDCRVIYIKTSHTCVWSVLWRPERQICHIILHRHNAVRICTYVQSYYVCIYAHDKWTAAGTAYSHTCSSPPRYYSDRWCLN